LSELRLGAGGQGVRRPAAKGVLMHSVDARLGFIVRRLPPLQQFRAQPHSH
jgi:hypothetical protein